MKILILTDLLTFSTDNSLSVYLNKQNVTSNRDTEAPPIAGIKAYPNPFKEVLQFDITLKEPIQLKLEIYNAQGRIVYSMADDEPGELNKTFSWDGSATTAGLYFYHLTTKYGTQTGKLVKM